MNTEHQLKSKLAWHMCQKSIKLNKNGTGAMTTAKNDIFIGLWLENFLFSGGIDFGRGSLLEDFSGWGDEWIFGWWGELSPNPIWGTQKSEKIKV